MAFDLRQKKALQAKLRFANVKSREHNGATIRYIEGWQAIAEANRIFGPDNWDRETRAPECIWSERIRGQASCLYTSKVRITVRAGDTTVVRDGIGTGFGRARSPDAAHDIAMKASETDATKRALATFGNPFGLALYDKELSQVTRPTKQDSTKYERQRSGGEPRLVLVGPTGRRRWFASTTELVEAVADLLPQLETLEALYAFWEANLENFSAVLEHNPKGGRGAVDEIVGQLKSRARDLGGVRSPGDEQAETTKAKRTGNNGKGALAEYGEHASSPAPIPKERRVRDADHLKFVARHPCIVCGRRPAQAHHIRFAQPSAMAMKVSDEYTVPLCAGHHDSVHRTGDERAWWAARKIDPIGVALQLWSVEDKTAEHPTHPSEALGDDGAREIDQAGPPSGKGEH